MVSDIETAEEKQLAISDAEETRSSQGEQDAVAARNVEDEQDDEGPTKKRGCTASAPRIAGCVCVCLIGTFIVLLIIMAIIAHAVVEKNQEEYLQPPSAVRRDIQKTIANEFDPMVLDKTSTDDIGEELCSGATATYTIGKLTGLSTINIERLDLVKGTGNLDMSPLGFKGNTWDGAFLVNTTFDTVQADIKVVIDVDDCLPIPIPSIDGTATIRGASTDLMIDMEGETKNLFTMLASEIQVNKANIMDLKFGYESIQVDLSTFGGLFQLPTIDFDAAFGSLFQTEINEMIEPLMMEALQESLNEELPFTP